MITGQRRRGQQDQGGSGIATIKNVPTIPARRGAAAWS